MRIWQTRGVLLSSMQRFCVTDDWTQSSNANRVLSEPWVGLTTFREVHDCIEDIDQSPHFALSDARAKREAETLQQIQPAYRSATSVDIGAPEESGAGQRETDPRAKTVRAEASTGDERESLPRFTAQLGSISYARRTRSGAISSSEGSGGRTTGMYASSEPAPLRQEGVQDSSHAQPVIHALIPVSVFRRSLSSLYRWNRNCWTVATLANQRSQGKQSAGPPACACHIFLCA